MRTPHLARIGYVSALHAPPRRDELDAMLSTWRRCNAERGITGFLLVHADSVFQMLEGFPDIIEALYETIARDPRHRFVARLIAEPVEQRSFGDWSMGYGRMTGVDLGAVAPLRPFLDPAFRYWHCDAAMAGALASAFATGRWRRAIS
jgi:hypothetical protein